ESGRARSGAQRSRERAAALRARGRARSSIVAGARRSRGGGAQARRSGDRDRVVAESSRVRRDQLRRALQPGDDARAGWTDDGGASLPRAFRANGPAGVLRKRHSRGICYPAKVTAERNVAQAFRPAIAALTAFAKASALKKRCATTVTVLVLLGAVSCGRVPDRPRLILLIS